MPLQGNIQDFSTTQLLNLMNLSRRTGTLTIFEGLPTDELDAMKKPKTVPGKPKAQVAFSKGKLVYAALAGQDSSLIAILNKAGKLNNEQTRALKARAENMPDKALAMRLIGARYVTQADIVNCIKQHILDVVYNLMVWTEGPFRFDDNRMPGRNSILVPIDLEPVIIEGAKRIRGEEEINKFIPSLDVSLRFPQNAKDKFKGVHLEVDQWKVVSYVNPKNPLRLIMKKLNMSEMQIKKIVFVLHQAGLIEVVQPQAAPVGQSPRRAARRQKQPDKRVVLSLIDKLKSL